MLRLDDVHVHIGKLHILQGVNLEVKGGECAALLGRNGVGKTTTLRAIMGLAPRSRGTVEFDGFDLARCPPHEVPRHGIGYVPQGRGIFPNLTVMENLCIGLPGKRDPEREDYVFGCFPRLKERLKQSGNTLSGGEQQMLAIARCLMMRPKLIILDEPTEGIMPRLVSQIRREIHRINQTGRFDPAGRAERRDRAQAVPAGVPDGERHHRLQRAFAGSQIAARDRASLPRAVEADK